MGNFFLTVMQFTDEHVNKRFQAHRFLYCDNIVNFFILAKKNVTYLQFVCIVIKKNLAKLRKVSILITTGIYCFSF